MLKNTLVTKLKLCIWKTLNTDCDAERVIRGMAQNGADIIFATSFGYMEPMLKVAKEFPNVKSKHATGYKQSQEYSPSYGLRLYPSKTRTRCYCRHDDKNK